MAKALDPHIVRIGVDVEQKLHHRFRMVVPWGSRSEVYRFIVLMVTEAIEQGGPPMLGALLAQKVKLALDLGDRKTPKNEK